MFNSARPARHRQRRGLTLHQLLCALAMIPLVPILLSTIFMPFVVRGGTFSYIDVAKSRAAMLEDAVNMYAIDVGSCPTTKQGLRALFSAPKELTDPKMWKGPYLDKAQLPLDPWNNAYEYQATSDAKFRVWSVGPDGASGTNDDISNL